GETRFGSQNFKALLHPSFQRVVWIFFLYFGQRRTDLGMIFEELDDITRRYMLTEFEAEESGSQPYRGKRLSALGHMQFPDLMRQAISSGSELTLIRSLLNPSYWNPTEPYMRNGVQHE